MTDNFSIVQRSEDGDKVLAASDSVQAMLEEARRLSAEQGIELEVVHSATNAVIAVTSPLSPGNFTPWTRVESPTFVAPHFHDWRPAYVRRRVQAVVYRSLTSKAWMVFDARTGGKVVVANTREAREVTNSMRAGFMIPAEEGVAASA